MSDTTLYCFGDTNLKIYYGRPTDDFFLILNQVPDSEFKNLTRSTIPFLTYWKDYDERIQGVLGRIGVGFLTDR